MNFIGFLTVAAIAVSITFTKKVIQRTPDSYKETCISFGLWFKKRED